MSFCPVTSDANFNYCAKVFSTRFLHYNFCFSLYILSMLWEAILILRMYFTTHQC